MTFPETDTIKQSINNPSEYQIHCKELKQTPLSFADKQNLFEKAIGQVIALLRQVSVLYIVPLYDILH